MALAELGLVGNTLLNSSLTLDAGKVEDRSVRVARRVDANPKPKPKPKPKPLYSSMSASAMDPEIERELRALMCRDDDANAEGTGDQALFQGHFNEEKQMASRYAACARTAPHLCQRHPCAASSLRSGGRLARWRSATLVPSSSRGLCPCKALRTGSVAGPYAMPCMCHNVRCWVGGGTVAHLHVGCATPANVSMCVALLPKKNTHTHTHFTSQGCCLRSCCRAIFSFFWEHTVRPECAGTICHTPSSTRLRAFPAVVVVHRRLDQDRTTPDVATEALSSFLNAFQDDEGRFGAFEADLEEADELVAVISKNEPTIDAEGGLSDVLLAEAAALMAADDGASAAVDTGATEMDHADMDGMETAEELAEMEEHRRAMLEKQKALAELQKQKRAELAQQQRLRLAEEERIERERAHEKEVEEAERTHPSL